MKILFVILVVGVSYLLISSGAGIAEYVLLSALGSVIILLLTSRAERRNSLSIFMILMSCYFLYAAFCHWFRLRNGFEFIGSLDGGDYYVVWTDDLLRFKNLSDVIWRVYLDGTAPQRHGGGIFVYFYYIARLAEACKIDLHWALQLSLMPFAALIGVVEYHILRLFDEIPQRTAYRAALIFGLCSALFWLSSFIVRDLPIILAFAVMTYLALSRKRLWFKLGVGLLMAAVCLSIRLASGVAALFYLLFFFENKEDRTYKLHMFIGIFIGAVALLLSPVWEDLSELREVYLQKEYVDGQESTLASFNSLPPVISNIMKVAYAQFHPFPAWRNLVNDGPSFLDCCYNITRFPDLWVVFFRLLACLVLVFGICNRACREFLTGNKALMLNLVYMLVLLLLQDSTIEERRKLIVYPFFFLMVVLFWQKMPERSKFNSVLVTGIVYAGLALLGMIRGFVG